MPLAQERERLKNELNRLQASLKLPPVDEEWNPVLREMQHVRERLERSYLSRPRGWFRKLRRAAGSIYSRLRPPIDLERLRRRPVEPLGAIALGASLSRKLAESNLDRIELTPVNFAEWVDAETRRQPGFDSAECFQTLNADLYPGYAHHAGGTGGCAFFIEAADKHHLLISGIVRWPPVSTPAAR
jgi:hypothetical protein